MEDDHPIHYLTTRIHDYLRSRSPLEYMQIDSCRKYGLSITDVLGAYEFEYRSTGGLYFPSGGPERGHELDVRDMNTHTLLMNVRRDLSGRLFYYTAYRRDELLNVLLPALEAAMVMDDLASIE
ncbi:MAG: hypothetical protein AB7L09_02320 [Nitrospira sp.]